MILEMRNMGVFTQPLEPFKKTHYSQISFLKEIKMMTLEWIMKCVI